MNITFPPPPLQNASAVESQQWLQTLWRYVRPSVSTSADVDFLIPSSSTYHGVNTLTAGRTLTLPLTSQVADGSAVIIQDESGNAGSHTITLAASAGDTVQGATTIASASGRRIAIKRGSVWFIA